MKDDKLNIKLSDPELPDFLKDARRNHGGMTVPDGFFARFEQQINEAIDQEVAQAAARQPEPQLRIDKPEAKVATLRPRRWIGIAATVALITVLGIVIQYNGEPQAQPEEMVETASITRAAVSDDVVSCGASIDDYSEDVADALLASASDYDVYELYCEI